MAGEPFLPAQAESEMPALRVVSWLMWRESRLLNRYPGLSQILDMTALHANGPCLAGSRAIRNGFWGAHFAAAMAALIFMGNHRAVLLLKRKGYARNKMEFKAIRQPFKSFMNDVYSLMMKRLLQA
jgi:hypothetical protein